MLAPARWTIELDDLGGGRVRVQLGPGVAVTVLADGSLRLFSELTSAEHCCEPAVAAMWVALGQYDGDCRRAADMLAELWDTEPAYTRAAMELWIEELCAIGVLRIEI